MPNAPTHDLITVISGIALAPLTYVIASEQFLLPYEVAMSHTLWLVGAHLLSGMMFSPDLDLDSAIDDRWGILFWIWRPYMWAVPHRNFWSHSLVFAPLLRLAYFYIVILGLLLGGAWLLDLIGVVVPDYANRLRLAVRGAMAAHPDRAFVFLVGFCTGSAAHSIADWLFTRGRRLLRGIGIDLHGDPRRHDRYVPRDRRVRG